LFVQTGFPFLVNLLQVFELVNNRNAYEQIPSLGIVVTFLILLSKDADGTKTTVLLGLFDKQAHLEWLEKHPSKKPAPGPKKTLSHFYRCVR
jgi:hypothetical protein